MALKRRKRRGDGRETNREKRNRGRKGREEVERKGREERNIRKEGKGERKGTI